jgi:ABC-type sugar transport system permease subunit
LSACSALRAQRAPAYAGSFCDPEQTSTFQWNSIELPSGHCGHACQPPVRDCDVLETGSAAGSTVVDQPFYPLGQSQCPTAGPGVNTVTIKNLLEMKSGMVVDGTLWTPNIWSFLVLSDPRFGWALVRSLAFAAGSTIGCFLIGFALAYLMYKPFPGQTLYYTSSSCPC